MNGYKSKRILRKKLDKPKKYILHSQKNIRYYEKTLSNKQKSNLLT